MRLACFTWLCTIAISYALYIIFAVVCEAGQYRDPSQTANCSECPLNYYQSNRGQTSCIYCGVGKVTMATATVNPTDCVGKFINKPQLIVLNVLIATSRKIGIKSVAFTFKFCKITMATATVVYRMCG